uniref:Cytochrome P450 2L1 n=1 Tax=Bursaphelenchus xylophilus TaxID=6326 RepID=A0A1I7SVA1_BURXY
MMLLDWVGEHVSVPFLLSTLLIIYVFHELYWKRRKLPPGPVPWLVAGNMLEEIQRLANILPINLLRTVTQDIEIDGYRFKKGSMVLPQVSILLNDPDHFPEPEEFRPDRFLDENQNLRRFEAFMPFSIGKRQCLGESLARMELFLIFANLLRNFSFESCDGEISNRRVLGLTVSPPKFRCKVRRREY